MFTSTIHAGDFAKASSQAKANVAACREALVKYVSEADPDHLIGKEVASRANALAEAEGRHRALALAEYAHGEGRDPYLAVCREVQQGADDGWSGRTNDARRAHFDGVLVVLRDLNPRL